MVAIEFNRQIQPGTFEFALNYLIEHKLDLSIFNEGYKNDHTGRPAYDPAVLLKIILFAYSKGITSSREIQSCCEHNVLFMALACNTVVHFTTIAAFVSRFSKEMETLFEHVLLVCHEQGLLGNELFAIDGCKMSSNTAKEWSGTLQELTEKRDKIRRQIQYHMEKHQQIDREDELQQDRGARIAQTIVTLEKSAEKIEGFLSSAEPRMGKGKKPKEVKSNITDNESAKMKTSKGTVQGYNGIAAVDKKHQIIIDAQVFGEGQEHHTLEPVLDAVEQRYKSLGIHDSVYETDILVTADTGFANERNMKYLYEKNINGYIPDNQFRSRDPKFTDQKVKYGKRHQDNRTRKKDIIPASDFTLDIENKTCICPAGNSLSFRSEKTLESGKQKLFFEGKLLQCRQCELKHKCMHNPESANDRKGNGRQVSFTVEANGKASYTDWMKERVDSDEGKYIYSHRMSVVEPVFANIGTHKKLSKFSLRGKTKVNGQWQLFCMVHNIEKLVNYGNLKP